MPAVAADGVQYSLLSTTRYDDALRNVAWNTRVNGGEPSAYMLLPYHFDRLLAAAEDHGWMASRQHMEYADLVAACNDSVRAALAQHGHGHLRVSSPVLLCFPPLINLAAAYSLLSRGCIHRDCDTIEHVCRVRDICSSSGKRYRAVNLP